MSRRPWTPEALAEVCRRYPHERTADIARDLGRSIGSIHGQANMLGPAGLIAMEDAEAGEIIQRSVSDGSNEQSFVEMGGYGTDNLYDISGTDENSIRGFWQGYRDLMGF